MTNSPPDTTSALMVPFNAVVMSQHAFISHIRACTVCHAVTYCDEGMSLRQHWHDARAAYRRALADAGLLDLP